MAHEKGFIHIVDGEGRSLHKIPKHKTHALVAHLIGEHIPVKHRQHAHGITFGKGIVHSFHHKKIPAGEIKKHAKKILHSGSGIYCEEAAEEFNRDTLVPEYDSIRNPRTSQGLGGKMIKKKVISSPPMAVSGVPIAFAEGSRGPQTAYVHSRGKGTRIKYFPDPLF